ncbi:hypothetical protein WS7_19776 [Xanthomonas citri pv. malvacearum str. GSPB2388]|nr:hypothetical protein WS7_19776 [Xanthomonas citri pv. malvacearum str. GSPB2388]
MHVGRTWLLEVEHDAQTIQMWRAAYAGHRSTGRHRIDARRLRRHAREVDDHPLGIGQPETAIGNLCAQFQPKAQRLALLLHAASPQDGKSLCSPQRRQKHQRGSASL